MHIKVTGGVFTDDDIKQMLARINAEAAKTPQRVPFRSKPRTWLNKYGLLVGMALLLLGQVLVLSWHSFKC